MAGREILLGVCGGIAIYKAVDLASRLTARGDRVTTILTRHAGRFVRPLLFQGVTRAPVYTDFLEERVEYREDHVNLADRCRVLVIAPATANVIGKIVSGIADDSLTTQAMAFGGPIVIAPAMHERMLLNPFVQENLERLRRAGYKIVEPEEGRLAGGAYGIGRLAAVEKIIAAIDQALGEAPGGSRAAGKV